MAVRGDIYYHKQFQFHNGAVGEKLALLLNTPGTKEPYIFVKATSQKGNNPSRPGCIEDRSLFFVPAGTAFFQSDTWVQLYDLYPMLPKDIDTNPDVHRVGSLSAELINEIIDCLLQTTGDDITPDQRKLLKPPLQESLEKLREKFGKRH